jgi:very-short-patch-repair endonuclease
MEMLNIKKNIEEFFKVNKCYLEHDFVISEHKDICISKKKFCKFSEIEKLEENIKIINGKEYISLYEALNIISKIKNYKVIEFQKTFGLVNITDTNNFKIAETINTKLSLQLLFTYSVHTFLQKNFNTLNLKVEENFLKRFKNIDIKYTRGPRVDIIIDDITMVLEYDEKEHLKYENITKDNERNKIIRTYGFEVIRFAEGANIYKFFKELKEIIKERQFLFDTSRLSEYIVNIFCSQGYDKELITLLTEEQCDDIKNGMELDNIGMNPKNLTLSILLNFIKCDDEEYIQEIKEYIDDLVYPYEEIDNDILLSPNAFDELLNKIDASKHTLILKIRGLYINIKNYFLKYLYDSNNKLLKINKNTIDTLDVLTNHSYNRGVKDSFTKCKILEEKNSKLEIELKILKELYKSQLPKNNDKIIKKEMASAPISLQIGNIIISEIPEIIYTGNTNDYINEDEIEILYKNNKDNVFKSTKMKSLKKCIGIIKEKIKYQTNNSGLLSGLLIGCRIKYNNDKKVITTNNKTTIILSSSDSDDERM